MYFNALLNVSHGKGVNPFSWFISMCVHEQVKKTATNSFNDWHPTLTVGTSIQDIDYSGVVFSCSVRRQFSLCIEQNHVSSFLYFAEIADLPQCSKQFLAKIIFIYIASYQCSCSLRRRSQFQFYTSTFKSGRRGIGKMMRILCIIDCECFTVASFISRNI